MLFFSKNQESVVMKKLVTALLLGTLVTSCSMDSDPTKDTKNNFKNGVEKLIPEADLVQRSAGQCNKLFNVQIDNVYLFEPGNTSSDTLIAHSLLSGLDTELRLVKSDRNPPGLSLVKVPGVVGEYKFSWDTSKIDTKRNYEVFYVELEHVAVGKNSLDIEECAISNKKEVKLGYVVETKQIEVNIENQLLSDDGIAEINHDLNISNTFKIKLPNNNKSSLKPYPLSTSVDSIDIIDFVDVEEINYSGVYNVVIDNEALAEHFKGQPEQDLAISLTAQAGTAYPEEFQVHFKFKSNTEIEDPATDAPKDINADTAEGK